MKAAMSGQHISLRRRLASGLAIWRAHTRQSFLDAQRALDYHRLLVGYLQEYVAVPVADARILEIGCGQTAVQTALFHTDGAAITGIDIEMPTYRLDMRTLVATARLNGWERALKSLARHTLFDKRYFSALAQAYGRPLDYANLDVRIMDAAQLTFEASEFDLVYSRNALEHMPDVDAAVREVNRVLKPTGLAVIDVHLFPSLSGGHAVEWIHPEPAHVPRVPPWDHLRENRYPENTFLNRLTLREYRAILSSHAHIVSEETTSEGEEFLTPDIARELAHEGYTREDLLTRTATFLLRKKA
jgi:SAM-dependent methyltransferase